MLVLAAYDVSTETAAGRKRLRRVAKVCKDYGQRVQKSLFECLVGEKELALLRSQLLDEINEQEDSLRLYLLDEVTRERTEHYGLGTPVDLEGPLVV